MGTKKLLILPDLSKGNGGPTTFFFFLKRNLRYLNIDTCHLFDSKISHCLVINGTRKIHLLIFLWIFKKPITVRLGSVYRSNIHEKSGLLGSLIFLPSYFAVNFSIFLASHIIFQSHTVKNQWQSNPIAKRKKFSVIYNPSLEQNLINVDFSIKYKLMEENRKEVNNITLRILTIEGNHPSPTISLPYLIYDYLKSKGKLTELFIFGKTGNDWKDICREDKNIFNLGFLKLDDLKKEIKKIDKPIYIPADNLTMGCPNSFILAQNYHIPAVALEKTPASELINLSGGGESILIQNIRSRAYLKNESNLNLISNKVYKILEKYKFYSKKAGNLKNYLSEKNIFEKYLISIGLGKNSSKFR